MISERIFNNIPPQKKIEYGYPHSNALLQFRLTLELYKSHNAARHWMKCDVINDIKLFPTVCHRTTVSQIFDVIQSEVGLQKQVH